MTTHIARTVSACAARLRLPLGASHDTSNAWRAVGSIVKAMSALLISVVGLLGAAVAAPSVYVAGSDGQFGYFDLATRAYTQISGTAFTGLRLTGLGYRTTTNTMYFNDWGVVTTLATVNPANGQSTAVAAYNYGVGVAASDTIGITFHPTTGAMYVYSYGLDEVFSVNPATAVGTTLGKSGFITVGRPNGKLAFVGNTLYGAMRVFPTSRNGLYTFNTTTGAATSLGNGSAAITYSDLIIFADGSALYGLDGTTLYQINTANGALTMLGALSGTDLPAAFTGAVIGAQVVPTVTLNPTNPPDPPGAVMSFVAAATDAPTPTVRWQRSTDGSVFTDISGETAATLAVTTATTPNIYYYRAIFTNAGGSATTTATRPPRRR